MSAVDEYGLSDENCVTGSLHTKIQAVGPYWNLSLFCERCGHLMGTEATERMLSMS